MKSNVLKLLSTKLTHIQSSTDSKSIDSKFTAMFLTDDRFTNGNLINFNITDVSILAKFPQYLYTSSFLLHISPLKKRHENGIKLNAKKH